MIETEAKRSDSVSVLDARASSIEAAPKTDRSTLETLPADADALDSLLEFEEDSDAGDGLEWCVDLGEELRAMSKFELWFALGAGEVPAATRVWKLGRERWQSATEIPDLACAFSLDRTALASIAEAQESARKAISERPMPVTAASTPAAPLFEMKKASKGIDLPEDRTSHRGSFGQLSLVATKTSSKAKARANKTPRRVSFAFLASAAVAAGVACGFSIHAGTESPSLRAQLSSFSKELGTKNLAGAALAPVVVAAPVPPAEIVAAALPAASSEPERADPVETAQPKPAPLPKVIHSTRRVTSTTVGQTRVSRRGH